MSGRRAGSSPLTRGKPRRSNGCELDRGLIPAHAGKTPRLPGASARRRAHPRSRGENVRCSRASHGGIGSSPLTRGKLHKWQLDELDTGLIPAHAGKTIF